MSFADGYCTYAEKCAGITVKLAFGATADCKERLGIICALQEQANGAGQFPATCGDALKTLACGADVNNLAACQFAGTLANGAVCEFDIQCQSNSCIKASGGGSGTPNPCGVCTARAAVTEACGSAKDCASGLRCVNDVCITPIAKSGTCNDSNTCATPYRCVGGTCVDPLQLNAGCTKAGNNADDPCDSSKGLFCVTNNNDAGTGTCGTFTLAAVNEPCGIVNKAFVLCSGELDCVKQAAGGSKCVPRPADGAMCEADGGAECKTPAECTGGKCAFNDPKRCK